MLFPEVVCSPFRLLLRVLSRKLLQVLADAYRSPDVDVLRRLSRPATQKTTKVTGY